MDSKYAYTWTKAFDLALYHNDNELLNEHISQVKKEVLMPMLVKKAKDISMAEEVCALTIAKFWERFYTHEGALPENMGGYLYTMALNAYIHHSKMKDKSMKRYISQEQVEINPAYEMDESAHLSMVGEDPLQAKEELYELLDKCMAALSEKCQQLLKLFIYEKKKMKEICQLIGIASPNAATKKKESCINNLRKLMYQEVHTLKNLGYV